MAVEGVLILLCLLLVLPLQTEVGALGVAGLRFPGEMALFAVLSLVAMLLFGLYDAPQLAVREGLGMIAPRLVVALATSGALIAAALWLLPGAAIEPGILALGLAAALVVLLIERALYRRVIRSPRLKPRVLVLGVGSRAAAVAELQGERTPEELPYEVVGFVAAERNGGFDVPADRVVERREGESLLDLARRLAVDELVVAVRDRRRHLPVRELLECKLHEISVTELSSFIERERCRVRLDSLNASWLIFGDGFRQDAVRLAVKRSVDLVCSLVLLLLASPLMLVTALAIRLESGAPVLYCQERIGRGNEPYRLYKFRSMRPDAERDGVPRWARGNDDRVTRVGRLIRKLRIDELPQVLNVLKGDMSFVGPRPERPLFVEQLSELMAYYPARHSLRPGITGWAQVCYPYGASIEDARHKLEYDLYYIKNHTVFLDALILLRTVGVVSFGEGAR